MNQPLIDAIIESTKADELDHDLLLNRFEIVVQVLEYEQLRQFRSMLDIVHPSEIVLDDQELIDVVVLDTIESGLDFDGLMDRYSLLLSVLEQEQLYLVQDMFD